MSNIIAIAPEQRALDRYIKSMLERLGQDIEKDVEKRIADMKLRIRLDKASGVIDEKTARTLETVTLRLGADRTLSTGKAIEMSCRELSGILVSQLPGPRKSTDLPTFKMRQMEREADRLLAQRGAPFFA